MKITIAILILILPLTGAYSQNDSIADSIKLYDDQLLKGKYTNEEYLVKMDSLLTDYFFLKGKSFSNDRLLTILKTYKKVAWYDNDFLKQRSLYYYYLTINADILNKGGLMFFYADKYRKQVGMNDPKATIPILFIMNYYYLNHDFNNVIDIFEREITFLNEQKNAIKREPFISQRYSNLLKIYHVAAKAYIEKKDLNNSKKNRDLLNELKSTLTYKEEATEFERVFATITLAHIECHIDLLEKKPEKVLQTINQSLNQLRAVESLYPEESRLYQGHIMELLVYYFKYTHQYKKMVALLDSMGFNQELNFQKAKMIDKAFAYSQMSDYKNAYYSLNKANQINEHKQKILTDEVNELLTSHIEAEFNKMGLEDAEKITRKRVIAIATISTLAVVIIGFLIYNRFQEKKRFAQNLLRLNLSTDIQIQEAMQRAAKEEQVKLGQNLHDDLTGSLATVIRKIEYLNKIATDETVTKSLKSTHELTVDIYEAVRSKSHILYLSAYEENDSLENSIKKIVSSSFPDNRFDYEIEVQKDATSKINSLTRIEILRIVQEAMNNILKHAQKATSLYVYLFKTENNEIYLQIGDNGKKMAAKFSKKGIGLKSIANRVQNLKGNLAISQEDDGFHIDIKIPTDN